MKKRINIGWSGMAGFGPAAWDRDEQQLSMHTPHHEEEHKDAETKHGKQHPGSLEKPT